VLAPTSSQHRFRGFAACAVASSFWGCGFFFGKIALAEMNVGAMVFYRLFFATLGLLPLLFTHPPRFNASEWRTLLFASFLGIPAQFLVEFYGLSLTTVSHAALMVGTIPVILAVGAMFYAKERLHRVGWLCLIFSTVGAGLIALAGHHKPTANGPSLEGDLLVVLSLLIALFWLLLNKKLVERHSAVVVTAYGVVSGTLMLCIIVPPIYGLPPVHGISLKAWGASAAAGLLCTASSTMLWNYGMTQVPASQAGVFLNLEPLIGSLLGIFILGDQLGPPAWFGGALILAAAITLTLRSKSSIEEPALL
jgi:drug/metabolite transporter (DMT)-like permease